jgi:acetyl-CoA carboxylase biotin carboxylase subunit
MKNKLKVMVANRGEIALRVLRTCKEMDLPTVAVFTESDRASLHAQYADEAVDIGPSQAYLDIPAIIQSALYSRCTAVHPGYGFLSENAAFAQAVEDAGLIFIGPRPETITIMGDKLASRKVARDAGLPVLPGTDEPLPYEFTGLEPGKISYPLLVKASAGGGGRGIRLVTAPEDLEAMIQAARQEALAAFGDDSVFLESMVQKARHIEVQILGDGTGQVLCLGERECSIQRRRQKLIEEAPATSLPAPLRQQLYDAAYRLGHSLKYRGLGTVEFLLDSKQKFYFIEVNPRIQVEHPVTEMITGLDLVREQLLLASGQRLQRQQDQITLHGAAIEARVLAEDTQQGFLPSTGQITYLKEPGGPGVRVDSALYPGIIITSDYDSLLAKVITWGEDRAAAIKRLNRALSEFEIGGLSTDIDFLMQIINSKAFISGHVTTTYLEKFTPQPIESETGLEPELALAAALLTQHQQSQSSARIESNCQNHWQYTGWREQMHGSL